MTTQEKQADGSNASVCSSVSDDWVIRGPIGIKERELWIKERMEACNRTLFDCQRYNQQAKEHPNKARWDEAAIQSIELMSLEEWDYAFSLLGRQPRKPASPVSKYILIGLLLFTAVWLGSEVFRLRRDLGIVNSEAVYWANEVRNLQSEIRDR